MRGLNELWSIIQDLRRGDEYTTDDLIAALESAAETIEEELE